jgi:hypothetical protein
MNKKDNYPFVPIKIASLAKKYGFDEKCFGMYEKGYTTGKGNGIKKKVDAKLFRMDISPAIKGTIELLQSSKHYEMYLKRPGMFEGTSVPEWCVPAPMYSQLIDWFLKKYNIFIEIQQVHGFYYDYKISRIIKISPGEQENNHLCTGIGVSFPAYDTSKIATEKGVAKAFDYIKNINLK